MTPKPAPADDQIVAELIDTQLCEDCDPFTSYYILNRLHEQGWEVVSRGELNQLKLHLAACLRILQSKRFKQLYYGDTHPLHMRVLRPLIEELWDDFGGWDIDDLEADRG